MSRVIFNKQTGKMEVMPDPRVRRGGRPTRGPLVTVPKIGPKLPPNILAGIGNIPGLNLDFSKLPKNIDLSNLDPRAINANPQGFQDMIERARAQEDFPTFTGPAFGGPPTGPAVEPDFSTLPEGIDPGGRFFTGPNGERMYSPPMPKAGPGMGQAQVMPPAINLDTGQPMDTSLRLPGLNQAPEMPTAPVQTAAPAPVPVQTTAPTPAPYTGAGYDAFGEQPFVSSVNRVESGLDPLTKQLLFGLDGKGGFIPGAMRAAEKVFYDDEGNPVVIEEKVAGLSPDQLRRKN